MATHTSIWTTKSEFETGTVNNVSIEGTEGNPYMEISDPYFCPSGEWRSEVRYLSPNGKISSLYFYEESTPGVTNIKGQIRAGPTQNPKDDGWTKWRPLGGLDTEGDPGILGTDFLYFQVRILFETKDPTVTPRVW